MDFEVVVRVTCPNCGKTGYIDDPEIDLNKYDQIECTGEFVCSECGYTELLPGYLG